jgi:ribosomal protein S18 acetylase RimI-like enzyme
LTLDAARATDNLVRTYFHLGLATSGATEVADECFRACIGPTPHAIANFAARLRLDPWAARRLAGIAACRPAFHVYVGPGDGPEHADELLSAAGFRHHYRLWQMMADPEPGSEMDVVFADGPTRRVVATFMAEQFFVRDRSPLRRQVAEATAYADGLELVLTAPRNQIRAAAMLCRDEDVCGMYNLCVASAYRSRGIGSQFVRWVRAKAAERGQIVSLQCDSRLADWYRLLGFRDAGVIDVYSLAKEAPKAIMSVI